MSDMLDWPLETARHVLDQLAADCVIRKKKPSANYVIWIRPPETDDARIVETTGDSDAQR